MSDPDAAPSRRAADSRGVERLDASVVSVFVAFGLSALLILLSRFISPALGSWNQVLTALILASFLIVVAFGQGLAILTGGLDLSVAALITLGGVLTTTLVGSESVLELPLLLGVLLICAAVGALNGIGVTLLRIPPFIMTLATSIIVASAALGWTAGTPRGGSPELLTALMKTDLLGLPTVIWFTIVFVAAATLVQSFSAFGRRLYAVGSNAEAARIAGLPVTRVTILAYALSAACAGLAGMMLVGYAGGATLRMGDSYLLPSIAAVVIGGSSILGGSGLVLGTVGGAILLTTLGTVIAAIGLDQGWRTVIEGGIILIALILLREEIFQRLAARRAAGASRSRGAARPAPSAR